MHGLELSRLTVILRFFVISFVSICSVVIQFSYLEHKQCEGCVGRGKGTGRICGGNRGNV